MNSEAFTRVQLLADIANADLPPLPQQLQSALFSATVEGDTGRLMELLGVVFNKGNTEA